MENKNFESYKTKIEQALADKVDMACFPGELSGFTLVDGFINSLVVTELDGEYGVSIPMVAIVGNTTGRMYFFALNKLVSDLEGVRKNV